MSVQTATPHNDVRKQIISVAAEMFHQQGIRSVTMDDIAHRLCMSKRTLYQIFADKESLLLACVIQHEEEVIKQLEDPSADGWYVIGKHNGQTSFECYLEVGKTNV